MCHAGEKKNIIHQHRKIVEFLIHSISWKKSGKIDQHVIHKVLSDVGDPLENNLFSFGLPRLPTRLHYLGGKSIVAYSYLTLSWVVSNRWFALDSHDFFSVTSERMIFFSGVEEISSERERMRAYIYMLDKTRRATISHAYTCKFKTMVTSWYYNGFKLRVCIEISVCGSGKVEPGVCGHR